MISTDLENSTAMGYVQLPEYLPIAIPGPLRPAGA